jgi:hypothetical protein
MVASFQSFTNSSHAVSNRFLQRPWFHCRSGHMGFMVDEMVLRVDFPCVLTFTLLHIHLLSYHPLLCSADTDSVNKFIQSVIHLFIHQWLYSPFCWALASLSLSLFQFLNLFTQTVGLLGRVISQSQGLYLYTGHHKHRINAHTNIHASSTIRT